MNKLRLSPAAQDDLVEIKTYIAQELQNPEAAIKTVSEITKRLRMLEEQADLGARISASIRLATDERFLVCSKYLAFYHTDAKAVYIDRILFGKRDYQSLLFDWKINQ
ncbi:MAG: type II toxin-antitoxin system RelE/ParE family toxin [Eubacteriales bacterium]|nr:type II toxin-antitoxin system RelE/ParE family toxin [Eubacteriales bacterium]